jgi:hypothetical protein
MHPDDRAALGAFMDEGVPTWQAWLGTRTGAADYLSPRGLEIFDALHRQIPEFFGSGWLAKATGPEHRVPEARILSPVLTYSDPVEQFAALLRIWTVAQLAARGRIEGLERVRRTLRTNVSTSRFLHTLLQELAGAGVHLGARVELEPVKAGGPGDLVLQAGDTSVFVEVTTLATDQQFTDGERAFDRQAAVLRGIETRYKVSFDGALPGRVAEDSERAWQERAENAARAAAAAGDEVGVQDPLNEEGLTVRPDTGRLGLRLSGPHVEVDTARRMLGAYDRKARQTRAAGTRSASKLLHWVRPGVLRFRLVRDDVPLCLFGWSICWLRGCLRGWCCWLGLGRGRMRRSWCCGTRSRCCVARLACRSRPGRTVRCSRS